MQRLETKQNIRVASTACLLFWLFEWLQKERPVCAGFVVRPTANSSVHPTDRFTYSSISCRKATMKKVQKDQQTLSVCESMFQLVPRGGFFLRAKQLQSSSFHRSQSQATWLWRTVDHCHQILKPSNETRNTSCFTSLCQHRTCTRV